MKDIPKEWIGFLVTVTGLDDFHPVGSFEEVTAFVTDENGKYLNFNFLVREGLYEYKYPLFEVASKLKSAAKKIGRGYTINSYRDDDSWVADFREVNLHYTGKCEVEAIMKAFGWMFDFENRRKNEKSNDRKYSNGSNLSGDDFFSSRI